MSPTPGSGYLGEPAMGWPIKRVGRDVQPSKKLLNGREEKLFQNFLGMQYGIFRGGPAVITSPPRRTPARIPPNRQSPAVAPLAGQTARSGLPSVLSKSGPGRTVPAPAPRCGWRAVVVTIRARPLETGLLLRTKSFGSEAIEVHPHSGWRRCWAN